MTVAGGGGGAGVVVVVDLVCPEVGLVLAGHTV